MTEQHSEYERGIGRLAFLLTYGGLMFLGMLTRPDASGWFILGWVAASLMAASGVRLATTSCGPDA